jgi:hypothetical protein
MAKVLTINSTTRVLANRDANRDDCTSFSADSRSIAEFMDKAAIGDP